MLRRFYLFVDSLLSPPPSTGSAGNPEILEFGTGVRTFEFPRFRLIFLLLTLIGLITVPALLAAGGALWLFRIGMESGSLFAWVVLFFFAPFVFLLGSFAVMADTALIAGISALLRKKPTLQIRFGGIRSKPPSYRDVRPVEIEQIDNRTSE